MTLLLFTLALLPGVALVGPVLIGWYFGSDWVLKVGLGFDVVAVLLGVGCLVWFPTAATEGAPAAAASTQLLTFLGGGLVVFGIMFAVASGWLLWGAREADPMSPPNRQ